MLTVTFTYALVNVESHPIPPDMGAPFPGLVSQICDPGVRHLTRFVRQICDRGVRHNPIHVSQKNDLG